MRSFAAFWNCNESCVYIHRERERERESQRPANRAAIDQWPLPIKPITRHAFNQTSHLQHRLSENLEKNSCLKYAPEKTNLESSFYCIWAVHENYRRQLLLQAALTIPLWSFLALCRSVACPCTHWWCSKNIFFSSCWASGQWLGS